jgi:hypothetical protein
LCFFNIPETSTGVKTDKPSISYPKGGNGKNYLLRRYRDEGSRR